MCVTMPNFVALGHTTWMWVGGPNNFGDAGARLFVWGVANP